MASAVGPSIESRRTPAGSAASRRAAWRSAPLPATTAPGKSTRRAARAAGARRARRAAVGEGCGREAPRRAAVGERARGPRAEGAPVDHTHSGVDAGHDERRASGGRRAREVGREGLERRDEQQRLARREREALGDGEPDAQAREAARPRAARDGVEVGGTQADRAQDVVDELEHVRRVALGRRLGLRARRAAASTTARRAVGVDVSRESRFIGARGIARRRSGGRTPSASPPPPGRRRTRSPGRAARAGDA